jgi:N utilization substance protein B
LSRRTARKNAFLNLYQSDINNSSLDSTIRRWREYRGELEPYAVRLARGVREEQQELDATLAEVSEGWPLHRMSVIDRTILRLALYEMLYVEDVPPDVAINEAVELARGFSGEDAPAFVGGVLRGAGVRAHREVGHGR